MNELHTTIQALNNNLFVVVTVISIFVTLMVFLFVMERFYVSPIAAVIFLMVGIFGSSYWFNSVAPQQSQQLQSAINSNYPVSIQGNLSEPTHDYRANDVVQFLASYQGSVVPCEFHIVEANKANNNFFQLTNPENLTGFLYCQKNETPIPLKTK